MLEPSSEHINLSCRVAMQVSLGCSRDPRGDQTGSEFPERLRELNSTQLNSSSVASCLVLPIIMLTVDVSCRGEGGRGAAGQLGVGGGLYTNQV